MSNVALLRTDRSRAEARPYVGPAEVVAVLPNEIEVRVTSSSGASSVRARLALAFPYEPAVGDQVLVIEGPEGSWVIGVLEGSGRVALAFKGDVDLRAEGGTLRLSSDKAVEIDAPDIAMLAGKLQQIAGSVAQRFVSLHQTITELLSVRAGQSHAVVDGASFAQSKTATVLAEGKVTINGKQISLG